MNEDWTKELDELLDYFSSITLPKPPFRLNEFTVIYDIRKFLNAHFTTLKKHNGVPSYRSCLLRLRELKQQIENAQSQKLPL